MTLVRKAAPYFQATAWYNSNFKTLRLSDYKDKYLVLFFYPSDFTFVCQTQIIALSNIKQQFQQIQCEIIAVSVDSLFCHMEYTLKRRQQGGLGQIYIPLLSDINKSITKSYGCLIEYGQDSSLSFRATYIIDRQGIIRHSSINDLPVGRDSYQILRLVKAFQFNDVHGETSPANWTNRQRNIHLNPKKSEQKCIIVEKD